MSEKDAARLVRRAPFETKLSVIGRIVKGDALRLRDARGRERTLQPGGYEHLRG